MVDLLWPYSSDPKEVSAAVSQLSDARIWTETFINPFYSLYPGWDTSDAKFLKYIQCQKRVYSGMPNYFASCISSINTGRKDFSAIQSLISLMGNTSIQSIPNGNSTLPVEGLFICLDIFTCLNSLKIF